MTTPKKLLTGMKPSVGHLLIICCRVLGRVPGKVCKASDANERSGVVLQYLLYGNFRIMLKDDQTVETIRHWKTVGLY